MANGMKGSGLGLAIANSLVELHGGTLRLQSQTGERRGGGRHLAEGSARACAPSRWRAWREAKSRPGRRVSTYQGINQPAGAQHLGSRLARAARSRHATTTSAASVRAVSPLTAAVAALSYGFGAVAAVCSSRPSEGCVQNANFGPLARDWMERHRSISTTSAWMATVLEREAVRTMMVIGGLER